MNTNADRIQSRTHPLLSLLLLHHPIKEEHQSDSSCGEGLHPAPQGVHVSPPLAPTQPVLSTVPVLKAGHAIHNKRWTYNTHQQCQNPHAHTHTHSKVDSAGAAGGGGALLGPVLVGHFSEVHHHAGFWTAVLHKALETPHSHFYRNKHTLGNKPSSAQCHSMSSNLQVFTEQITPSRTYTCGFHKVILITGAPNAQSLL